MRTTVDIPDGMYRRLKARAAREGTSTKALILNGVEQVLTERPRPAGPRVALPLVKSRRPGRLALDNARIYKVISFP
jgi:plasmid stability protein